MNILQIASGIDLGHPIFMSSVFLAGFLSFFAPCTFPLLPVYFGILTDQEGGRLFKLGKWTINLRPLAKTLLFVGGISTTFITLGFGAGALGAYINGRYFNLISGFIVILLGLHQMGLFRIQFLEKYRVLRLKRTLKTDLLGTYLLGLTFSFGWTPCVGPVLGAVLVVSADGGQAFYGGFLMMLYAIGLMIPFLTMALLSNVLMDQFTKMEAHLGTIKKVGGALIVVMGVFLMTENLNLITAFIGKLF